MYEGLGVAKASKRVGFGRVSRAIDTLSRIELEAKTREEDRKRIEKDNCDEGKGEI